MKKVGGTKKQDENRVEGCGNEGCMDRKPAWIYQTESSPEDDACFCRVILVRLWESFYLQRENWMQLLRTSR